jgi:hypothetical protein
MPADTLVRIYCCFCSKLVHDYPRLTNMSELAFLIGNVKNDSVPATAKNPNPRPKPVLSTFELLEIGK